MSSDHAPGEAAISIRDVGKVYQIYDCPQDRLKQALLRWRRRQFFREFWALRGVRFEVARGETVGIIGRNGSGKSTLLQIIAGTLRPSEGEVRTRGRVAALLELGSGFNPQFTGRENVYLNGAILGLSTQQIDERFDEVAAFADIGDFIYQPIKTYSTGMVVRLAFAVQALLEPDVLIVDEALAVGDEAFQRKCFGWLERFRERGGTTLLVTHGAQLVVQLCDRAVLLEQGELRAIGRSKPVVDAYQKLLYGTPAQAEAVRAGLRACQGHAENLRVDESAVGVGEGAGTPANTAASYDENMPRPPEVVYGTGEAEISEVGMFDEAGARVNVLVCGQRCFWRYRVRFEVDGSEASFGMMLKTIQGIDVFGVCSSQLHQALPRVAAGQVVDVEFDLRLNVAPGTYYLNSGVTCRRDEGEVYLHRRVDVAAIRVVPPDERELYGLTFVEPRINCRVARGQAVARV